MKPSAQLSALLEFLQRRLPWPVEGPLAELVEPQEAQRPRTIKRRRPARTRGIDFDSFLEKPGILTEADVSPEMLEAFLEKRRGLPCGGSEVKLCLEDGQLAERCTQDMRGKIAYCQKRKCPLRKGRRVPLEDLG